MGWWRLAIRLHAQLPFTPSKLSVCLFKSKVGKDECSQVDTRALQIGLRDCLSALSARVGWWRLAIRIYLQLPITPSMPSFYLFRSSVGKNQCAQVRYQGVATLVCKIVCPPCLQGWGGGTWQSGIRTLAIDSIHAISLFVQEFSRLKAVVLGTMPGRSKLGLRD